jgi:arsenate reductase-like glutaredoxin family protein
MDFDTSNPIWTTMRTTWENVCVTVFEDNSKKLPAKNFIIAHMEILHLFMPKADLAHLADCQKNSNDPDVDILRRTMGTCRIARVLFHDLGMKKSLQLFISYVDEQIKNLEFHDFEKSEKDSFERIMRQEVTQLKEANVKPDDGKAAAIQYLCRPIRLHLLDMNDEWYNRLWARLKTLAVSLGLLVRWPWEAALFGKEKIEGCPLTVKIPMDLLTKSANAREVGLDLIKGEKTLSEMKRILTSNAKLLLQLDPTMNLDFA